MKRILIAATTTEYGYQRETLRGVRSYAEEQRWTLLVRLEKTAIESLSPSYFKDVDGCILDLTDMNFFRRFADVPGPKVSYCDCLASSPVPRVTMDNAQAGRLAAEHFLERNIKNMAFFGTDLGDHYALQRQDGFVNTLKGRNARFESLSHTIVSENDGRAFRDWLDRALKPVGLLAADDNRARMIAQRCVEWGINVPRDVLILGFNNDVFHCELCQPSLSSVIMPSRAIGYKAAEMLDQLMQGRKLSKEEFLVPSPGVIERASTQTVAFDCPELDRALRYIRQNAAQAIGVKQVVDHVAVSKRSLETLFRKHFSHGPGEELRRTRLALAKFYLATTNRSIGEVARLSGFSNIAHLGRVLYRYEKQTPVEFRRRHASVGE